MTFRLSIVGYLCKWCDAVMGEDLVCPGCKWVDPPTRRPQSVPDLDPVHPNRSVLCSREQAGQKVQAMTFLVQIYYEEKQHPCRVLRLDMDWLQWRLSKENIDQPFECVVIVGA